MKKQIIIKPGITKELAGKVVSDIAYHTSDSYLDTNQVIVTFTDDTFIAFGIEREDGDPVLTNNHFPPLESYGFYPPYRTDYESGEVKFEHYIQQQIDLGVVKPMSEERLKQLIEAEQDKRKQRDYQQYLRLKEMFEKKEEK